MHAVKNFKMGAFNSTFPLSHSTGTKKLNGKIILQIAIIVETVLMVDNRLGVIIYRKSKIRKRYIPKVELIIHSYTIIYYRIIFNTHVINIQDVKF